MNGPKVIRKLVFAGVCHAETREHPTRSYAPISNMTFSSTYSINNLWSSFSQIAVDTVSSKSIGEVMEKKSIKIPENGGYKTLKSLICR